MVRRADILVGNSKETGRQLAERLNVDPRNVRAIWNPIDIDHIESISKEPLPAKHPRDVASILAVGRLDQVKRPDILVKAFALTREKIAVQLWLCGDGPLSASVEVQIRNLGLQDDVALLGFDPNPYRWMANADLFILTSDFEGFPNALIEAQALGLPAVATRCPTGPDEIVKDGVTGLLVPVGDVDVLAAAIFDLLFDEDRRRRMGAAARERARELFDHRKIIVQWEDVLDPPDREVRE
jgi:glycosyltransferase involved in cell wall biosynthesis